MVYDLPPTQLYSPWLALASVSASNPDNEYLSFELDAETLANANHGEYNWVGGKSYTIRMSLGDVLYFDGVTVVDWKDGGTIDAGEAEEEIK